MLNISVNKNANIAFCAKSPNNKKQENNNKAKKFNKKKLLLSLAALGTLAVTAIAIAKNKKQLPIQKTNDIKNNVDLPALITKNNQTEEISALAGKKETVIQSLNSCTDTKQEPIKELQEVLQEQIQPEKQAATKDNTFVQHYNKRIPRKNKSKWAKKHKVAIPDLPKTTHIQQEAVKKNIPIQQIKKPETKIIKESNSEISKPTIIENIVDNNQSKQFTDKSQVFEQKPIPQEITSAPTQKTTEISQKVEEKETDLSITDNNKLKINTEFIKNSATKAGDIAKTIGVGAKEAGKVLNCALDAAGEYTGKAGKTLGHTLGTIGDHTKNVANTAKDNISKNGSIVIEKTKDRAKEAGIVLSCIIGAIGKHTVNAGKKAKDGVTKAAKITGKGIATAAGKTKNTAVKYGPKIAENITDGAIKAAEITGKGIATAAGKTKNTAVKYGPKIAENITDGAIKAAKITGKGIAMAAGKTKNTAVKYGPKIAENITDGAKATANTACKTAEAVKDGTTKAIKAIKGPELTPEEKKFAEKIRDSYIKEIDDTVEAVKDGTVKAAKITGKGIATAAGKTKNTAVKYGPKIAENITDGAIKAAEITGKGAKAAGNLTSKTAQNIKNGIEENSPKVKSFAKKTKENLVEFYRKLMSKEKKSIPPQQILLPGENRLLLEDKGSIVKRIPVRDFEWLDEKTKKELSWEGAREIETDKLRKSINSVNRRTGNGKRGIIQNVKRFAHNKDNRGLTVEHVDKKGYLTTWKINDNGEVTLIDKIKLTEQTAQ